MSKNNQDFIIDEDQGSYLVSVSDLMAGLLFIFIITLMVFALSLKEIENKKKETVEALTNNKKVRASLLNDIKHSLKDAGIDVIIVEDQGILRLPEKLLFPSAKAILIDQGKEDLITLSNTLAKLLPCYSGSENIDKLDGCSDSDWNPGKLDTILIEGHTDDLPLSQLSKYDDNWDLSAKRAIETFKFITSSSPNLLTLVNARELPVFGVSGYESLRPVDSEKTELARSLNRRIDLRFIMTPPKADLEIIQKIKDDL